jgi:hypothetical protein
MGFEVTIKLFAASGEVSKLLNMAESDINIVQIDLGS